jgi:PAS domain S-box-containing protein
MADKSNQKSAKHFIKKSTDITARKREEADLRRMATVVIDSNDAITIQDLDGKISAWNRGAERMYGYTEAEARTTNIQETIPKAKRQEALEFMKRVLNEEVTSFETQRLTRDGRTLDVWMTVTKLVDEAGKTIGIATTEHDITERKREEARLTEEKKNLEKVNLELDSFVYTASHDLRAPLRAISSFASFLEEDNRDQLGETGRDHLQEIRKGIERMTKLIDDLLTLSKISRLQNPYEAMDMNALVESARKRIEFDLKEKNTKLRIQPNLPTVYCDRIKMEEVFVNLLNNAVKFYSKSSQAPEIEVGCLETEDEYQFYVADNGIGIEPRFHEQIFGLFKRLHTQEEYEGTGAGLNIVKRIIEDHKGRVWVESDLGKGAKFIFTIPKHFKVDGMVIK